MIVTFYSFKGGVGRSMALVNVGEILADWGYRVVLVDWDLEAPGLERYLTTSAAEVSRLVAAPGLVDLVLDYKDALVRPPAAGERTTAGHDTGSPATHRRVGDVVLRRPASYLVHVSTAIPRAGSLRLLTAGTRHGEAAERYAATVRSFDWDEFYDKWAGGSWIDFLRTDLESEADVVLVDSRTGVTEQGGVCTHHLADLVLLLCASNDMNLEGTRWMALALSHPRLSALRGDRALAAIPIASRVEQTAQVDELNEFRVRFANEFAGYAPVGETSPRDFFLLTEIPYIPLFSLKERIVARDPEERREPKLYGAYVRVADTIVAHGIRASRLREPTARRPIIAADTPAPTRRERPAGRFVLSHDERDDAIAARLADGLRAAGVDVARGSAEAADPGARRSSFDLARAAGVILLIGERGILPAQAAELVLAVQQRALRADFRILPLLLPGAGALPSVIARLQAVQIGVNGGETDPSVHAHVAARLVAESNLAFGAPATSPFLGLQAFTEKQSLFFFGRDEDVDEIVGRLIGPPTFPGARGGGLADSTSRQARYLVLSGAPGVGKSSLVNAGLLPALRRGALPGWSRDWHVLSISVRTDPLADLAATLYEPGAAASLTDLHLQITQGADDTLAVAVRQLMGRGQSVALVVDDAERFFAPGGPVDQVRDRLSALLSRALDTPDLRLLVVVVVRTDFWPLALQLARYETVHPVMRFFELRGLSARGRRDAIEGPAALGGLTWEAGLVERVAAASEEMPEVTWLLALILHLLWERRDGTVLTNAAYQALGGPAAAVALRAEEAFAALAPDERTRARQLLLALVTLGEDGQSRIRAITRDEAVTAAGGGPEGERTLLYLSGARDPSRASGATPGQVVNVLSAPQQAVDRVVLAHDGLPQAWSTMRVWIESEHEMLRRRGELESLSLAWEHSGSPTTGLPRGRRLTDYESIPPALDRAARFLAAAREQQVQEFRHRIVVGVGFGLLVALGLVLANTTLGLRLVASSGLQWAPAVAALSGVLGGIVSLVLGFNPDRRDARPRATRWFLVSMPVNAAVLALLVWFALRDWLRPDLDLLRVAAIGFMVGVFAERAVGQLVQRVEANLAPPLGGADDPSRRRVS